MGLFFGVKYINPTADEATIATSSAVICLGILTHPTPIKYVQLNA